MNKMTLAYILFRIAFSGSLLPPYFKGAVLISVQCYQRITTKKASFLRSVFWWAGNCTCISLSLSTYPFVSLHRLAIHWDRSDDSLLVRHFRQGRQCAQQEPSLSPLHLGDGAGAGTTIETGFTLRLRSHHIDQMNRLSCIVSSNRILIHS